jgi:Kae1-associated kinase Bud32
MRDEKLQGAEAVLFEEKIAGIDAVVKDRVVKKYRSHALDAKLRKARTGREVRLLRRAKEAGVPCPFVLEVGKTHFAMNKILGDILARVGMSAKSAGIAGELLAKMHSANMVHGDYTPANIMDSGKGGLVVIDFGLGAFSVDIEDKATDVVTMRKALGEKLAKNFIFGYLKAKGSGKIVEHAKEIESRARYMERAA